MPRHAQPRHICMIRPGIWADDSFNALSCRARLLWLGLAGFLDCAGRGVYEPARLAGEILGEEAADYGKLFAELRDGGMIELYAVAQVTYMQVVDFARHQRVDRRRVSRLPDRTGRVARRPMGAKPVPAVSENPQERKKPEATARPAAARTGPPAPLRILGMAGGLSASPALARVASLHAPRPQVRRPQGSKGQIPGIRNRHDPRSCRAGPRGRANARFLPPVGEPSAGGARGA